MPFLIIFHLLLIGIALSGLHSFRVIRFGRRFGASVEDMIAAAREKRIIWVSGGVAAGYLVLVLLSLLISDKLYVWVVLVPFAYLLTWVALHFMEI